MAGRTSILEITQLLSATYRSIDVRVAALRDGDKWACGLAVVRLSYEEPPLAEARLSELRQRYTPVATKNFKILLGIRPFAEWDDFCTGCFTGRIRIGDLDVYLHQPMNVRDLANEIQTNTWGVRPVDSISWPGVFVSVGISDPRLGQEPLVREVGPLGYSFPLEAVNELCEVNVAHGQNPGSGFYMSAPVFARIETVSLLTREGKIETKIRKHTALSGLSGSVVLRGRNFGMAESSSWRRTLTSFETREEVAPIKTLAAVASGLPVVDREKWVEVKLFHEKLGDVYQLMRTADSLIPAAQRNVLFETLKYFCPEGALKQLVVSPHSRKSVTLKTSAAFEVHVAWLLSLCGLSTIVLGEFGHLVAPETNIQRGSVDLLASKDGSETVLLVGCTLGAPRGEDFGNLRNLQGILEREVFGGTSARVFPVLFTGARGQPAYWKLENKLWGIPILDADRIEILLSLISKGAGKQLLEFLGNPMLFDLQEPDLP